MAFSKGFFILKKNRENVFESKFLSLDGEDILTGGCTMAEFHCTVKPRYSASAYNIIPPIEYINFGPKKCFHSYLYIGNRENLAIEYNFDQSL